MTQADFVAVGVTRKTHLVLTGNDDQAETNTLPARTIDELEARFTRVSQQIEALAENAANESRQDTNPIQSVVETTTSWPWGTR